MIAQTTQVLITPPPTPNGGLHVGHVGGPYLRADLNRRLLLALGGRAAHLSHIDNYQTYVEKKALERGREVDEFRSDMTALIDADFQHFKIHFDRKIDNLTTAYRSYLADALSQLFASPRARVRPQFLSRGAAHSAVESYVSGICPGCLHTAAANVCENCGLPTDVTMLHNAIDDLTGSSEFIEDAAPSGIPTEYYIDAADLDWLRHLHAEIQPDNRFIGKLLRDIDTHALTLTMRSTYGYQVAEQRVINPWVEIFFAHLYSLVVLVSGREPETLDAARIALQGADDVEIAYYFGSDNSYYYAVVFPLLARELEVPTMVPRALKANRFLKINGRKISSSRNNAVWARELRSVSDEMTLRSALSGACPEFAESCLDENAWRQASNWPEPSADDQRTFRDPQTLLGKGFHQALAALADPAEFSVGDLRNRIDKAVDFATSTRGSRTERDEILAMVGYLRSALEI